MFRDYLKKLEKFISRLFKREPAVLMGKKRKQLEFIFTKEELEEILSQMIVEDAQYAVYGFEGGRFLFHGKPAEIHSIFSLLFAEEDENLLDRLDSELIKMPDGRVVFPVVVAMPVELSAEDLEILRRGTSFLRSKLREIVEEYEIKEFKNLPVRDKFTVL